MVDDGSQDGTAAQTQARFPQVQVVRHDVTRGFGAAVNTGFKAACGTFLAAVNNDALVAWNSLDRLVGFLRTHPDAGAAAPSILDRDGHNQRVGFDFPRPPWQRLHAAVRGSRPTRGTGAPEAPYRAEYVRGACVIFKRAALQQAGLFDEQFHMFDEEIDLFRRLAPVRLADLGRTGGDRHPSCRLKHEEPPGSRDRVPLPSTVVSQHLSLLP